MILRKITAFAAALLLAVSMTGCKELPMDYETLTAELQPVVIGETLTLNIPLPMEKAKGIAVAVTEGTAPAPRISVDYTAPDLKITGTAEGNAEVQIEFSAGWLYKKSHITIPVVVLLPQLEAKITCDTLPITYDTVTISDFGMEKVAHMEMDMGSTATLTITSPENDVTITAATDRIATSLAVAQEGAGLRLKPVRPSNEMFLITVSKEGFRDARLYCEVKVNATPTPLALSEGTDADVKVEKGKTVTLPLKTDGELSVSTGDNAVATAAVKDSSVTVTGVSEGDCTITVTSKKENYLDSSLILNCTVTAAAPPPAPAATSGPYAELVNEIVKYTNIERASEGLAPLKLSNALSKAADIRAKETAADASHTRPDGRRGLTAITDAGLGEYNATGENLSGSDESETGAQIVQRWMDSPPHRAAILMPEFKTIGIGVYYDGDMYRYCQLFTGTKF